MCVYGLSVTDFNELIGDATGQYNDSFYALLELPVGGGARSPARTQFDHGSL